MEKSQKGYWQGGQADPSKSWWVLYKGSSLSLQLVDNIGPNKSEGTPGNYAEEFVDGTEEKNSNNDSICTSDDEGESYPVDKVGKVDNVQAN